MKRVTRDSIHPRRPVKAVAFLAMMPPMLARSFCRALNGGKLLCRPRSRPSSEKMPHLQYCLDAACGCTAQDVDRQNRPACQRAFGLHTVVAPPKSIDWAPQQLIIFWITHSNSKTIAIIGCLSFPLPPPFSMRAYTVDLFYSPYICNYIYYKYRALVGHSTSLRPSFPLPQFWEGSGLV